MMNDMFYHLNMLNIILLLCFCFIPQLNEWRLVEENLKDYKQTKTQKKRKDVALFFAVKDYKDDSIPDLKNPIRDADSIAWELEHYYDFEIYKYHNPTFEEIENTIERWQKSPANNIDQLFVFFTGHGEYRAFNEMGYFIPTDARRDNYSTYFDLLSLGNSIFKIPCDHILLAIDACYSGNIHELAQKDLPFNTEDKDILDSIKQHNIVYQQLANKSRLVITSGGKNIRTPDGKKHSPFSNAILLALRKERIHRDKLLIYAELLAYLAQGVHPVPHEGKWSLGNHQDEGGGFVFATNKNFSEYKKHWTKRHYPQRSKKSLAIEGIVLNDNTPLAGVLIIADSGERVLTNKDGYFHFPIAVQRKESITLHFSKIGYQKLSRIITPPFNNSIILKKS